MSQENIHQIRNIIMQHEGLFKEQVQALHKLYRVQKLAMEELQKLFQFHNVSHEIQNYNPVLEEKSSEAVKLNSQESESNSPVALIQSPCTGNEFNGSKEENTFFLKTVERKSLSNSQNKLRKRIDLERLPEEYMNESDYQFVANDLGADPLQHFHQKNQPSGRSDSATKQSKTTTDFLSEKLSQSPQQLKTPEQVADVTSMSDSLSQDATKSISILGVSVQLPLHCRIIKEIPDNLMCHDFPSPGNTPLSEIYGAVCEPVEGGQIQGTPPFLESHYRKRSPQIQLHTDGPEKNTSIGKSSENLTEGELNQEESFRYEKKDLEKQSITEEACESIAAKILLSFAPNRSSGDDKLECFQTQVEKEPNGSFRDSARRCKRMNRSTSTGVVNHKNNVRAHVVKFTKNVHQKQVQNPRRK
ncbi:hypothetical protein H6P81_000796 [Aristolochia fimbriata]|uniref:Shugoshin C-terminal domain-containing protein n=1 Tax=Aristolochia fimbriata TaxID=158543 RepID=A0AAV7F9Q0_ARIFI|nr:hypothetical protein H6P81_000796 [Aristolochia fimbriata]